MQTCPQTVGLHHQPLTSPCCSLCLAVLLVGTVTATNNYNKERQFRSLEETAKKDDRVFIKRSEWAALVCRALQG